MPEIDLGRPTLDELVVELILDGRAGPILDLATFEPVSLTGILAELRRRTGQDCGANMDVWRDWYLNDCPEATELGRLRVEYAGTRRRILEFERRARRILARRARGAPTGPGT